MVLDNDNRVRMASDLAKCQRCEFRWHGNGPIMPSGPTPNDVMILADQPPRQDDRAGKITHKGDASRLLENRLKMVGLDLYQCFFGHVISCWSDPTIRKVTKTAAVPCHANLKAQVRACQPKAVLVLGAVALDVVTDRKRSLKKDHGQPFVPEAGPLIGIPVVATYHPAGFKHEGPQARSNLNNWSADLATFAGMLKGLQRHTIHQATYPAPHHVAHDPVQG